jgi:hypothetical protein
VATAAQAVNGRVPTGRQSCHATTAQMPNVASLTCEKPRLLWRFTIETPTALLFAHTSPSRFLVEIRLMAGGSAAYWREDG